MACRKLRGDWLSSGGVEWGINLYRQGVKGHNTCYLQWFSQVFIGAHSLDRAR